MVTPRTGRPRGRPKNFLRDPERFAIPYARALMTVYQASENAAFATAAAELRGVKIEAKFVGPRRMRGRGAVPPGILVPYRAEEGRGWEQAYRRGNTLKEFFEHKASVLRRKAHRAKAEYPKWYGAMVRAFELALRPEKDQEFSATEIMRLAMSVGEAAYAHAALLPLLSAKFLCSPDLLPKV